MENSTRRIPPRRPDLLSREIDGEFVVVDEAAGQAHELSGDVAAVWRAAGDGSDTALSQDQVSEVVAELVALGLLQETVGLTRRAMIQRGGALVALTGIATIGLPQAAAFASSGVLTNTTLSLNPASVGVGATVTASGTVARQTSNGASINEGTVTLKQGSTTIQSGIAVSSGLFSTNFAAPATVGTFPYTAVFGATSTYATSTSPISNLVVHAPVLIDFSSTSSGSPGLLNAGDTIVFTFDAAIASGSLPANGSTLTLANGSGSAPTTLSIPGVLSATTTIGPNGSYCKNNKSVTATYNPTLSSGGTVLTVTILAITGTASDLQTSSSGSSVTFSPASSLKDASGASATGSVTKTQLFF